MDVLIISAGALVLAGLAYLAFFYKGDGGGEDMYDND